VIYYVKIFKNVFNNQLSSLQVYSLISRVSIHRRNFVRHLPGKRRLNTQNLFDRILFFIWNSWCYHLSDCPSYVYFLGVKTSIIIKQEETVTQMVASRVSDEKTRFCQTSCGCVFQQPYYPGRCVSQNWWDLQGLTMGCLETFFYKSLHSKSLGIFCGVVLKSYWNLVSEGYCKLKMVLSGSSVLGAIILMKKLKSRKFTKLQHSLENITSLLD